jgi:two-component system, NarL family, sensor histidine kinase UhpB
MGESAHGRKWRDPWSIRAVDSGHPVTEDASQSRRTAGPLGFLRRTADVSLYVRVLAVNAAILTLSVALLIFTPVTVSRNVTNFEVAVLLSGLVLTIVANAILLRLSLRPLRKLMELMLVIDVFEPGVRTPAQGPEEVASVISRFNAMLDRLEHERRHSMRRVLVAQEAERRRVAQELHDEIGQNLTAAVLELNRVREGGVVLTDALDDAQSLARESLETLSAITARLRPATFDDLGLASALQSLAADSERRTGVEVETAVDGQVNGLDADAELVLFRVAQEAVTNALRHAECSRVTIRLRRDDGQVLLRVEDDGGGVGDAVSGAGIRGMRERAAMIGGRLKITTATIGGTAVELQVPSAGGEHVDHD